MSLAKQPLSASGQKTELSMDELIIQVNLPAPNNPMVVRALKSWTVSQLKRHVGQQCSQVDPDDIRILFQGRALKDSERFQDIDLGNNSFLHVLRGGQHVRQLRFNVDATRSTRSSSTGEDSYTNFFYVYCKSPCNKVTPGKLRVRCADCKRGAFELNLDQEPNSWADVLTPKTARGRCGSEGCHGKFAEFYFKCALHWTSENDLSAPLSMVQPNIKNVPCMICTEEEQVMLVFSCQDGHAICESCFADYCRLQLDSHHFQCTQHLVNIGYTTGCPNKCPDSYIPDAHHFRILGPEQYDRYQKMSAESFVKADGGQLCPVASCCNPVYPSPGNKMTCTACQHQFCKNCLRRDHAGSCDSIEAALEESQRVDPGRAARAASVVLMRTICKQCPSCKAPTEKNEGCSHMTCQARLPRGTICGFHWCWVCVKKWGSNCQSSHWFAS